MRERDVILAYMDELARLHAQVQLWWREEDKHPITAHFSRVDDEGSKICLRLQRALPSDFALKQKVTWVFPLDGSRFMASIRFLGRGDYLEAFFTLPEAVRHAERRSKMRARFGAREKATVTVLEGLQDERGATGPLIDLSLDGLCLRLDRAVSIRDKTHLVVNTELFAPGTFLPIVKIEQLPHSPALECGGVVAYLRDTEDGVLMGIGFRDPEPVVSQIIAQILGRRLPRFNQGYPQRRRGLLQARDLGLDEEPPDDTDLDSRTEPSVEVSTGPGHGDPLFGLEMGSPVQDPAEVKATREARLLLLKKKSKRILLIMADDLERAILMATIKLDGYEKLHQARNYMEALNHHRVFNLDLVIIQQHLGTHTAQDFLLRLRKQGFGQDLPTILLAEEMDVRTKIMAKATQIAHVQKVPVDYDGELRDVLLRLLHLQNSPS